MAGVSHFPQSHRDGSGGVVDGGGTVINIPPGKEPGHQRHAYTDD